MISTDLLTTTCEQIAQVAAHRRRLNRTPLGGSAAKRGLTMFDYFVRRLDLAWFDRPQRPAPPLYTRPAREKHLEPVAHNTPIGDVTAIGELVQLTAEQLAIWRAA